MNPFLPLIKLSALCLLISPAAVADELQAKLEGIDEYYIKSFDEWLEWTNSYKVQS